jgi:hypothetical protein
MLPVHPCSSILEGIEASKASSECPVNKWFRSFNQVHACARSYMFSQVAYNKEAVRHFGICLQDLKNKVDDNYKRKVLKEERKDAVKELKDFMDHGGCIIIYAISLQGPLQSP